MSEGYAEVKARLDEIVTAVADENLPLDEALALYEEAVMLGNKVSNLIETDIAERSEQEQALAMEAAEADGADGADDAVSADDAGVAAPEASATCGSAEDVPVENARDLGEDAPAGDALVDGSSNEEASDETTPTH